MQEETSGVSHCINNFAVDTIEFDDESDEEVSAVSADSILPYELVERILTYLPTAAIFRARCVCKKWNEIVTSKDFPWDSSHLLSQKPLYVMFTRSDEPVGYAYDHVLRKWDGIDIPRIKSSYWLIASSYGLVGSMCTEMRKVYVCNPITRHYKELDEPPGPTSPNYSALAISVNKISRHYKVSIIKSKDIWRNISEWNFSIHIYDSETMTWVTSLQEVLTGWRSGDQSVICDGVLYFIIYLTGGGAPDNRHRLIAYNLKSGSSNAPFMNNFVLMPCSLTCARLMNMKEKLVMVGGIAKQHHRYTMEGIGIWVLKGREWQEIDRKPPEFFQGSGELDNIFASSGMDDLIYIQAYGAPILLVFHLDQMQWKWSKECPVIEGVPLQIFSGFCFEPRPEIDP